MDDLERRKRIAEVEKLEAEARQAKLNTQQTEEEKEAELELVKAETAKVESQLASDKSSKAIVGGCTAGCLTTIVILGAASSVATGIWVESGAVGAIAFLVGGCVGVFTWRYIRRLQEARSDEGTD